MSKYTIINEEELIKVSTPECEQITEFFFSNLLDCQTQTRDMLKKENVIDEELVKCSVQATVNQLFTDFMNIPVTKAYNLSEDGQFSKEDIIFINKNTKGLAFAYHKLYDDYTNNSVINRYIKDFKVLEKQYFDNEEVSNQKYLV